MLLLVVGTIGASGQEAKPTQNAITASTKGDIVGIWQGTLMEPNTPKGVRWVIEISRATDGSYKASLFNADQGNPPFPFTTVTLDGSDVKLEGPVTAIAGKLSGDGMTIHGSWGVEDPNPIAVSFARTSPESAWAIPEPMKPMAADANPSLEVATIKPGRPGVRGKTFGFNGTHFTALNTNVDDLIAIAYGFHTKQIIGAPDWFEGDLYDIDGEPDVPGRPSIRQMGVMLQGLLADRFALKFHHEQRELSVYAIHVASGGPKMKLTAAGRNDHQGFSFRSLGNLDVRNMAMADFAKWMQSTVMDKPVVDQTGLTARYDFSLLWTPDESQFAQFRETRGPIPPTAGDNPNTPPSLYTAVQEQLGLKISVTKAMDDVIVIDHVERPSPN